MGLTALEDLANALLGRFTFVGAKRTATSSGVTIDLGRVDVTDPSYGAKGNGTADDTSAIQAAITAAAAGTSVVIPPGTYKITSTLSIATSRVSLVGIGNPTLDSYCSAEPALQIDSVSGCAISGLRLTRSTAGDPAEYEDGVAVYGAAADCVVANVKASGFHKGLRVDGEEGATPGTVTNLVLDRVHGTDSPTNFGLYIKDASHVTLNDCIAEDNYLTGFKCQNTTFVTINGGSYSNNANDGGTAAAGISGFSGGDLFSIGGGVVVQGNQDNGIDIKSSDLNRDDPAANGYVRRIQISGARVYNNGKRGISAVTTVDDDLVPLMHSTVIENVIADGNGEEGVLVSGPYVSLSGIAARSNGFEGLVVNAQCWQVAGSGIMCVGNGLDTADTYGEMRVGGRHVRLSSVVLVGDQIDSTGTPEVTDPTPEYAARAATTANIANLAAASVTQDGVTLVEGDVCLVKDQTDETENGLYAVGVVGGGTAPFTRTADYTTGDPLQGDIIDVVDGTQAGLWEQTEAGPITVGSSDIVFAARAIVTASRYALECDSTAVDMTIDGLSVGYVTQPEVVKLRGDGHRVSYRLRNNLVDAATWLEMGRWGMTTGGMIRVKAEVRIVDRYDKTKRAWITLDETFYNDGSSGQDGPDVSGSVSYVGGISNATARVARSSNNVLLQIRGEAGATMLGVADVEVFT